MNIGELTIKIGNISYPELQRYQRIFDTIIDSQVLATIKKGSISLHLDDLGEIAMIDAHPILYKRSKLQEIKKSDILK